MKLDKLHVGVGFTGSFCTYDQIYKQIQNIINQNAIVHPIFSEASQTIDCRFGNAQEFVQKIKDMTGNDPITSIETAEPLGPGNMLDILIIAPCTGNTVAKLANAITDTPVLMAAKGHLRNNKPLVISLSTNDALSMNFKNIGLLLNAKNVYFVPFGQDNYEKKPCSMISHTDLIVPTLELALENKQIQPIVQSPY